MTARCETIGKFVLPIFRSLVAKELVNTHHLTQTEAAKKLRTTQAAVSYYINSKRAIKSTKQFNSILPRIHALAKETAQQLVSQETTPDDVTIDFCKLCSTFFEPEENQTYDSYSI